MSQSNVPPQLNIDVSTMSAFERAILYARVSADDTFREGRNIMGQIEMGREYAAQRGYQVVGEFQEDVRGASGHDIDLPQLSQIREMAHQRQFDVLIVRELDRLSRSLAKQLIVEEELRRAGVRVEYVLETYDDTPEGRLNKHIRATIAEYEREKINQRLSRGRRQSVKAGNVAVSDRPPYGYRAVKRDGKKVLEVVEEEAQFVRIMYEWFINGDETGKKLSLAGIARKLGELGVPTRGDRQKHVHKVAGYAKWHTATVRRILQSETYIGTWHYGKLGDNEVITLEVPAIIPVELWEAAQPIFAENRQKAKRNLRHQYLFNQRITCGHCGYKMASITRSTNGKKYAYYRCPAEMTSGRSTRSCDLPGFKVERVDKGVWQWIKAVLTQPHLLAEGLEAQQAKQTEDNAPLTQRLAIIDDLIKEDKAKLEKVLDLYLSGDFPKEMLVERKNRLADTIKNLERERQGVVNQLEAQSLLPQQIESIETFASNIQQGIGTVDDDFESQRRIIEMLDVQLRAAVEDNERVVYVECRLGQGHLSIAELDSYAKLWYNGHRLNSPLYLVLYQNQHTEWWATPKQTAQTIQSGERVF